LVPVIVPIVATIALAAWLGIVYWAAAHPDWDRRGDGLMTKMGIIVKPRKDRKLVGCNKLLCYVCCCSRTISAATLFDRDQDERRIHHYVLLWTGILILILFLVPTSGWLGWALVGVAFYRLQDLIFSTLDNAFQLTERSRRSDPYDGPALVVLALVNIFQIVLIFAIAYLVFTSHAPGSFSKLPAGRFGDFFLSWISLPPLGGGASPHSTTAKILTMIEAGTGLLIIVISIGRFLSVNTERRDKAKKPDESRI
jgi:hypothetical protein